MEKDNPSQDLVEIEREDEVGEDLLPAEDRQRVVTEYDETPVGQEEVETADQVDPDYPEFDPEADRG